MNYSIIYSAEADKTITKYKKSNPVVYKKIVSLIKELHEHPRTGTGHPEPLVGGNLVRYSRRITHSDRMIYNIYDETVTVDIISVAGHYDDK